MASADDVEDAVLDVLEEVEKISAEAKKNEKKLTKREKEKQGRYQVFQNEPFDWQLPCKHVEVKRNSTFHCSRLENNDIEAFRRRLFYTNKKLDQDSFLLNYVCVEKSKRSRVRESERKKGRPYTTAFFLSLKTGSKVRVCRQSFEAAILPFGRKRVSGIISRYYTNPTSTLTEGRGGDRSSSSKSKEDAGLEKLKFTLHNLLSP